MSMSSVDEKLKDFVVFYPEGIAYYSEGLPQRGYPGMQTQIKANLEKVPSSLVDFAPTGLGISAQSATLGFR